MDRMPEFAWPLSRLGPAGRTMRGAMVQPLSKIRLSAKLAYRIQVSFFDGFKNGILQGLHFLGVLGGDHLRRIGLSVLLQNDLDPVIDRSSYRADRIKAHKF